MWKKWHFHCKSSGAKFDASNLCRKSVVSSLNASDKVALPLKNVYNVAKVAAENWMLPTSSNLCRKSGVSSVDASEKVARPFLKIDF